jgi:hypothetical protein
MTGRGVPQPSVGSSEASLPGLSPTASTTRVLLGPASVVWKRPSVRTANRRLLASEKPGSAIDQVNGSGLCAPRRLSGNSV